MHSFFKTTFLVCFTNKLFHNVKFSILEVDCVLSPFHAGEIEISLALFSPFYVESTVSALLWWPPFSCICLSVLFNFLCEEQKGYRVLNASQRCVFFLVAVAVLHKTV